MGHGAPASSALPVAIPVAGVAVAGDLATGSVALASGADRPLLVVTLPAGGRPLDGALVATMVARVAREVAVSPPPGATVDGTGGGLLADTVAIDGGDEVVAAHDARIAILRQRLATIAGTPGMARVTDDLDQRLHKAQAARRLALVRLGQAPVADDDERDDRRPTRPFLPRLAAAWRPRDQGPAVRIVSRRALAVPAPLWAAARIGHGWRPAPSPRLVTLAAGHHAVATGTSQRRRLASARRSLTTARRLLAGAAPVAAPARLVLTGLWRWDGSDRWALTPPA